MSHPEKICPICEVGMLSEANHSSDFIYNGETIRVENLENYICDKCGADPVFPDQIKRNQQVIADSKRKYNNMLTGEEIKQFRVRFGLTQKDASELFGGGANAFSKYERGDVIQSEPMDALIWLVRNHPYLIEDLKVKAGIDVTLDYSSVSSSYHTTAVGKCRVSEISRQRVTKMRPTAYDCIVRGARLACNNEEIDDETESAAA